MKRDDMMRRLSIAGLRPLEAAEAYRVALHIMRYERDQLIVKAVAAGLSVRVVGELFGISHPRVVQVVNQHRGDLPRRAPTLHATKTA